MVLKKDRQRGFWIFALALAAATFLAYMPAWNGRPIWDDDGHLTKPELRSLHGLAQIWTKPGATQQYYPLTHSVFWLEHRIWHDAVLPYHLVNIFLHVASALLLFRILRKLGLPGAWLAAAIFALHPVQVESVAWISELKNTLSTFLLLLGSLFYFRFDEERGASFYLTSLTLFLLGLLAKSVIATLPAALLVVFWWKRGQIRWKRDVLPLLPFVGLGLGASLITIWMERTQIGAEGDEFRFSIVERSLIAGRAVSFYLCKLICRINLTFIYPRWQIDASVWWQYLFPAGVIAILIVCYFLRKRSRGPLAIGLLYIGLLFPALGFVNVYPFIFSFVADHFQYLASISVIGASAFAIVELIPNRASLIVGTGLCLTLGLLTWRQAHAYVDAETLYRTTINKNPGCWMAHNNLGNILMRSGRTDEATGHYQEALLLRPTYLEAEYNLSHALLTRGEVDEAIRHGEAALAIRSTSPEAHNNLANALRRNGRFSEAIAHYELSLAGAPTVPGTKNNLAWLLATCSDKTFRDIPRALSLAKEANEQSGGSNQIILHTLSAAYAQSGDLSQARAVAQKALTLAQSAGDVEAAKVLEKEISQLDAHLRN